MAEKFSRYSISSLGYSPKYYSYGQIYQDGFDNRFSDYLNGLYNNSVTHQAIINDLTDYIYGDGLIASDPAKQSELDRFLPKKKLKTAIRSKILQNTVIFDVMKSKTGVPLWFRNIDASLIRVAEMDEDTLKPTKFLFRQSWDQGKTDLYNKAREYWRITNKKFEGLYYWFDNGTFEVPYGRPKYLAALDPIELESSCYRMHNHGAQNGMFPSFFMEMETSGNAEVDKKTEKAIYDQIAGAANGGKGVIRFRQAGDGNQMTITTPNMTGIDKVYEGQYAQAEIGILKGHQIPSPTLISGLNTKSSGFSNPAEEMEYAMKILWEKRIRPERDEIEEILKPLLDMIGIEASFVGGETEIEDEVQEEVAEEELSDEVNDNIKNLSGRQLQAIERTVRKFNKGDISRDQAAMLLKSGYGLSDSQIDVWLKGKEGMFSKLWMSLNPFKKKKSALDEFIEMGESMDDSLSDWEVYSIDVVDYEKEEARDKEIEELNKEALKLTSTGVARPNAKSEQDGNKGNVQFKVRYRYSGDKTGDREFCKKMLSADKIYRKEDIIAMGSLPVNPGFGPNGSDTYSIWEWKGGAYCHHKWERITFVKKGLEGGVDVRNPNTKKLSESMADGRGMNPRNPKLVGTRPIDTPTRGKLNLSSVLSEIKSLNGTTPN